MEKKKIIVISLIRLFIQTVKNNIPQIAFLILVLQFFITIRKLPYINIVSNYYLAVIVIILALVWIFNYKYITNKLLLRIAMFSFILAIPTSILHIEKASNTLGLVAFIFLIVAIGQRIFIERKILQSVKDE